MLGLVSFRHRCPEVYIDLNEGAVAIGFQSDIGTLFASRGQVQFWRAFSHSLEPTRHCAAFHRLSANRPEADVEPQLLL